MNFSKKILVSVLFALSACGTGNQPMSSVGVKGDVNFNSGKNVAIINPVSNGYVFDVGAKTGTNISVKFNFNQAFKTKSTSGTSQKVIEDIKSAKFYLTTTPADPLTDPTATGTATFSAEFDPDRVFTFSNVPADATYSIAVELFEDLTIQTDTTNIIKLNNGVTPTPYTGGSMDKGVAVSTNSVLVDEFNQIVGSPTAPLSIEPKLLDGTGASVDATVVPEPGTDQTGNPGFDCSPGATCAIEP